MVVGEKIEFYINLLGLNIWGLFWETFQQESFLESFHFFNV